MRQTLKQYINTVQQAIKDIALLKDSKEIQAYCISYDLDNGLCYYIRNNTDSMWVTEIEANLSQLIKTTCNKSQLKRVVNTGYITLTPMLLNYDKEFTIKSLRARLKLAKNLDKRL